MKSFVSSILLAALLVPVGSHARAVTIHPQSARPYLLSGPADKDTINKRLAAFPYPVSPVLDAFLSGDEARKRAVTTRFFDGLPKSHYTSTRRLFEMMFQYDIVMALGFATPAQEQQMLDLSLPRVREFMERYPGADPPPDAPNGFTEDLMAVGLCALNFPSHPEAQAWIDQSVGLLSKQLDLYFPDGTGLESPRYHAWMLLLLAEYLPALKRCTDADLIGHPALERALEWLPRFSHGPFAIGDLPYSPPNSGDTTIAEAYASFLPWAALIRDRNPVLSGRLMHWWRLTGSPVNKGWVFPTTFPQIIDAGLPTTPRAPAVSTYAPSFGEVMFRSESRTPGDFHATFRAGRRHTSHHHADQGHIDLIAFGVPLAIDSGSGPYDETIKTWNRQTMAHNTVRCMVPEPEGTRDISGSFHAFGSSATVDYAAGGTGYGENAVRHIVFMKGDYMVVWDQISAVRSSDWFFHTPADTSRPDGGLEWHANKVISHTPWGVDLDIHFLLPGGPLPAPSVPTGNLSIDHTTENGMASHHPEPVTAKLFTRQGDGRFGDWTDPGDPKDFGGDPWKLKWQRYLSVRAPTPDGDYLTILHPRKVGVTPALSASLVGASPTRVSITINYNGRIDRIAIDANGAAVARGSDALVRFSKTWPRSGAIGAARLVKTDQTTTILNDPLKTTGTVDVTLGTLALGNSERIPDTAPVAIRSNGTLNLGNHHENVDQLLMDNGTLAGTGTLKVASVVSHGGKWHSPVICAGVITIHGGKLDLGDHTHHAAGLTVGGEPLPAKTYNATNRPDLFSGSGNLVISSAGYF